MLADPTRALVEAATLAARPEYRSELLALLHDIKNNGRATAEELYEVFLQSYLFAGFPAALESVRALERVFSVIHTPHDEAGSEEIANDYKQFATQGADLYSKVYASNAARVREEMLRLSPELAAWAMIEGYGKTLSRPGLDTKTRELCTVAQLTQLGWERQLYSHILGARNLGASAAKITDAALIGSHADPKLFEIAEQLIKKLV